MRKCLLLLAAVWLTTGSLPAATNRIREITNGPPTALATNDPVEVEFRKIMEADDEAQADVDEMIRENEAKGATGGALPDAELNRRIREKFAPVRKAYEGFISRHPRHVGARVAYGSFLGDIHDEDGAQEQLEKALTLDTNNPAVYNNLANIYGHTGPVKKAFEFYSRAIELNPREPVYYHNFGTTVYLFRTDAKEFFAITEQQVFDKALVLYSNALWFDPTNFPLASDVAQTYYGIKPTRTDDALRAWTNALNIAHDEIEREGVYLHFARFKLNAGRFAEAHAHLNDVTNAMYTDLKKRLTRNLENQEAQARTNPPTPITTRTSTNAASVR